MNRDFCKLLLLILVIASCQLSNEREPKQEEINFTEESNEPSFSEVPMQCTNKNTLITQGNFTYQLIQNSKMAYEVHWGEKEKVRKYPENFKCWKTIDNETCDHTPKIELMTNEEILLKVPTSTSSAGNCSPIEYKLIYLPKDKNKKPFEIAHYLDTRNNYIVYTNSLDSISVMNIETKMEQSFGLKPKPYFEFKTIDYSIDSIQIENNFLVFKYLIGTDNDYGYTKRKFKIKT